MHFLTIVRNVQARSGLPADGRDVVRVVAVEPLLGEVQELGHELLVGPALVEVVLPRAEVPTAEKHGERVYKTIRTDVILYTACKTHFWTLYRGGKGMES